MNLPPPPLLRPLFAKLASARPQASPDTLLLLVCTWWVVSGNGAFWRALLAGRPLTDPASWGLVMAIGTTLIALHFCFIAPLAHRRTVKPLLSVLILVAAFAGYYMERFTLYLDPSMLRNVLRTDLNEARELLAWTMLPQLLLQAGPPLALLWWLRPAPLSLRRDGQGSGSGIGMAIAITLRHLAPRLGIWLLVAALGIGALWTVFQDAAATMRNHKEMRYLITPGNAVWSLATVLGQDTQQLKRPQTPIGIDALRGPRAAAVDRKPMRVVLVIGETARAANWGLNGYARQTTPRLAAMPELLAFTQVSSCGTNTEVSLPCMFSPGGRRRYDEALIRRSQSLLHVLQRTGVQVLWRDNQSGCKGVCEGLRQDTVSAQTSPKFCTSERCLDEALLEGADGALRRLPGGDQFLVLHQLGNHGPAYDRRYPDSFRRFTPVCDTADLRLCSREQIVNAYDNALLYTDHFLAEAISWLKNSGSAYDTALVYVSDHGESLGEQGLYLHGLPYAIAPEVQTRVPMVIWLSDNMSKSQRIDLACLQRRARQSASHDHLFHSLMGLLDVRSALYEPALDLFAGCRT